MESSNPLNMEKLLTMMLDMQKQMMEDRNDMQKQMMEDRKEMQKQADKDRKEMQMQADKDRKEMQQQITSLMDKIADRTTASSTTLAGNTVDMYGILKNELPEYVHTDESCFDDWMGRHGPTIEDRGKSLTEDMKRNLIVSKLDVTAYKTYCEHILPKKYEEIIYKETIDNLKTIFGPNKSLFKRRLECFTIRCPKGSDSFCPYRDNANNIKKHFDIANMAAVDVETLKCIALLGSLDDSTHSEVRLRIINRLNATKDDQPPNINDLTEECINWHTARHENRMMESKDILAVRKSHQKKWHRRNSSEERRTQFSNNRRRNESPSWKKSTAPPGQRRRHVNNVVAYAADDSRTYLRVDINGRQTQLQLDTGADITMISRRTWNQIGSPHLDDTAVSIKTADGSPMKIEGRFNGDFTIYDVSGRTYRGQGPCYVTDSTDLLGLEWAIVMPQYNDMRKEFNCRMTTNLDKIREDTVNGLQQRFADVFEAGLGRCTKTKAKLFLKPNARPVYCKKRPIPFASQPAIDAEIDRLSSEGVWTRVDYSQWAAPIVAVKKSNGSIRMCADFSTGLNDSLMLHQHPLPTAEDVFNKLNGGQLYSQIDFADAYLQIEVDEADKELLTINTHRGLFRYNRLPFGVKSAPGIFQEIIDSMISGLTGVAAYLDDIIVTGRSTDEHRHNLEALFKRIHNFGFRVRLAKCNFLMPEIRYLGHIIDKDGRRPDPDKIRAITQMPPPKDVTQLRSFLGMINYYGNFIDKMRQLRAPLDHLLKKDTPFEWSTDCQEAFDSAKEVLTSPLLLTHYDPSLDIIVAADASDYGIGAVILHRYPDGSEKAICHTSRSLTDAEKKYGQIEKEGLALVFAVRKFHRYLFGRRFTLLTDHKPLLTIFGNKNGLPVYSANRLLRWSLILRAYDFKIEYRNTTTFGQADALSRLIADNVPNTEDIVIARATIEAEAEYQAAAVFIPIKMDDIAKQTKIDDMLNNVIDYVRTDKWPKTRSTPVAQLYSQRQSLSINDDCIFFGPRIVIPSTLRRRVLDQLHDGHPGENRMKVLARQYVYWPNINKDIENFVKSCRSCQEVQKTPVKTELYTWPQSEQPWTRVHIDFAGPLDGKMYLVIVDAYSKWPEIIEMTSTTATATIRQLDRIFAQFGFPETLVSDNGTQFTSSDFADYCTSNGINHVRSPPFHPQSNGQAERFVDTFKRALQKIKSRSSTTTSEALQKFLMVYRRTPCTSSPGSKSPAENFLGRRLRTTLSLLNTPKSILKTRNEKMEDQFNRHNNARPKKFEPQDLVWIRDYRAGQPLWHPGQVILRHGQALYDVIMDNRITRRHANQLSPRQPDNTEFTFMDTFNLPKPTPVQSTQEPDEPETNVRDQDEPEPDADQAPEQPGTSNQLPRRSQRDRRAPDRLIVNMDPRTKSYV